MGNQHSILKPLDGYLNMTSNKCSKKNVEQPINQRLTKRVETRTVVKQPKPLPELMVDLSVSTHKKIIHAFNEYSILFHRNKSITPIVQQQIIAETDKIIVLLCSLPPKTGHCAIVISSQFRFKLIDYLVVNKCHLLQGRVSNADRLNLFDKNNALVIDLIELAADCDLDGDSAMNDTIGSTDDVSGSTNKEIGSTDDVSSSTNKAIDYTNEAVKESDEAKSNPNDLTNHSTLDKDPIDDSTVKNNISTAVSDDSTTKNNVSTPANDSPVKPTDVTVKNESESEDSAVGDLNDDSTGETRHISGADEGN